MRYLILVFFYVNGLMGDDGPIVEISLGKIKGFYEKSFEGRAYSAFEGIPYAKPPIGDLRFEAPQPALPWTNVLNASTRYACKQPENPYMPIGKAKHSEDCLYLNVYVPKTELSENDNFDVIVNIHGGAFMIGSSSFAGPRYLMDRDIVYVNLNYRLGILGFLSTEDDVVPGNNGLKDQQLALKWVQSHIKSFGGNPKSVTLMGMSAGGASVHFHYFSPQSKGLFHRGISQSGTALVPWALQENALEKTKKLAETLNCQNSSLRNLINCLKAVDVDDVINKTIIFYNAYGFPISPFAPVVEVKSNSSFLTKHPYSQLKNGDVYDVPWLASIARDEGIFGIYSLYKILDEVDLNWNKYSEHMFDYKHTCPETNKKRIAETIKQYYFKNEKVSKSNLKSLVEVFSDRLIKVGFETALEMQAQTASSPIYAAIYGYDLSAPSKKVLNVTLDGVWHGAESLLLHEHKNPLIKFIPDKPDILMKNILIDFVTSFAKNSIPKSDKVEWKPFTPTNPQYLLINDYNNLTMTEIPKLSPKEFWSSMGFKENNEIIS